MRLIPSQVLSCDSAAERTIFGYLTEIRFSAYDIGLHSLNIGHHEYKRWGEAEKIAKQPLMVILIGLRKRLRRGRRRRMLFLRLWLKL